MTRAFRGPTRWETCSIPRWPRVLTGALFGLLLIFLTPAAPAAPVRAEVIAAGGEPLTGLKLLGPVQYERVEAHRAATATYNGYMAELENVRNALRAWTLTQGEDAIGRPYEVYKNGIDAAFTADGQYDVYWGIK